jgi:GNAT superfamily N-acetyltransferase
VALRQALRADLPEVVDIWVDAFAEDPFHRWVQPDPDRWSDYAQAWMTFVAELCCERGHTFLDDRVAVAWVPPDLPLVGPDDFDRAGAILAVHAPASRAEGAIATILSAREHAPDESHWTLQYLGVRAAAQGSGLGAAAIAPGLAGCDRDGLPCGLISTNVRNLSFYERHGFAVVAEVPTPDDAVALRPILRPARRR